MNQCVHCGRPCGSSSLFCGQCASDGPLLLDRSEQSLNRLTAAARRIAEVDPDTQQLYKRKPRPSRLSRLHDISAEIQRESTPLPAALASKFHEVMTEQDDELAMQAAWYIEPDEDEEKEEEKKERGGAHGGGG